MAPASPAPAPAAPVKPGFAPLESFGGDIPAPSASGPATAAGRDSVMSLSDISPSAAEPASAPLVPPTLPGPEGKATQVGAAPASRQLDDLSRITAEDPGRYEVQSEFGRGGIGRVLLALDQHLGREVAVKELLRGAEGDASVRFLREARITGRLEHPGIVPVYELGRRGDGSLYYTMKLVRGDTLSDRIAAATGLPDRLRLLPHFLDLCQAIAYAHDQGVLHRDLKPQNVMVGKFGETVVLDWGLAKVKGVADARAGDLEAASRLMKEAGAFDTAQGRLLGTPAYMAPEQAEGLIDQVDERSDVWSLGAILYEILAGRRAYDGTNAWEVVGKVLHETPAPIATIEPAAPRELIAIVEKCLTRDRARRYQDAGELAEDVARFQSGGLVSAYDYSMATLVKRWVKKRWPVLATAATALAVLIVVGIFSFISIRNQRNIAVQQRALAERREKEANQNLAEAYVQYGLQAEKGNRWNDARLLFARALALAGRENARSGLYREAVRPRRVLLRKTIKTDQLENFPVAVSPDGKIIVTGGCQQIEKRRCLAGVAQVWNAQSGEQVGQLNGPTDMVSAVAFAPDGKSVAVGSWDGSARVFSPGGDELLNLSGHAGVTGIVYSTDGKDLITAGDEGEVRRWSAETGDMRTTLAGHEGGAIALALAPDGRRLFTGGADHSVRSWDLNSGRVTWTAEGDTQWVRAVAVSLDGAQALSGGREKVIKLWSLKDGKKLAEFEGHTGGINAVAFLPDGSAVSAAEDGDLRFWNINDRRCTDIVRAHAGAVKSLAVTPDGKTLVTTGADGAIKIWSIADSAGIVTIAAHEGQVSTLTFSPDGKSLISGGMDHKIKLWRDGKMVREYTGHQGFVRALAFAPDGKTFVSASWDETVRVWDVETGECIRTLMGHKGNIGAVAFSVNGKSLASGGDDLTVRIWDSNTWQPRVIAKAHDKPISAVGFVGRSEVFSAGWDGKLKIWGIGDAPVRTLDVSAQGVAVVAAAPEGSFILAGGFDGGLKLFAWQGEILANTPFPVELGRHGCAVTGVGLMKEKVAASAACDSTRLWSLDGQALATISEWRNASSLASISDLVAVGYDDGTLLLLSVPAETFSRGDTQLKEALAETGLAAEGFSPRVAKP